MFSKQGKSKRGQWAKVTKMIEIEKLRIAINYDPITGLCAWRNRPIEHFYRRQDWITWNKRMAGKRVGAIANIHGQDVMVFSFGGKNMRLHRAIWAITYDEWPNIIDHINGNPLDNRLENLRNTDLLGNARNQRKRDGKGFPSGITMRSGNYRVRVRARNKNHNIGTFADFEIALEARDFAMELAGYAPHHGKRQ